MSTAFSSFNQSNRGNAFTQSIIKARNYQQPSGSIIAISGRTGIVSNDAITWRSITLPIVSVSAASVGGICYAKELNLWVAVGTITVEGSAYCLVLTSQDNGSTWNTYVTSIQGNFNHIAWSPNLGIFVAVGSDYSQPFNFGLVATSTDAVNWTVQTDPLPNTEIPIRVCWSADIGRFAFVTGVSNWATSSNGMNWDEVINNTGASLEAQDIVGTSGATTPQFVTTPTNVGADIWATWDGVDLNNAAYYRSNANILGLDWFGITFSPSLQKYVMISTESHYAVSADPAVGLDYSSGTGGPDTWTTFGSLPTDVFHDWTRIIWSSRLALFIIIGATLTTTSIATSPDATNCTVRTTPSIGLSDIACNG